MKSVFPAMLTRRQRATQEGAHALEVLKQAALHYGRESTGGASPIEAGAKLRIAAKAYLAAELEFTDAVTEESANRRLANERTD